VKYPSIVLKIVKRLDLLKRGKGQASSFKSDLLTNGGIFWSNKLNHHLSFKSPTHPKPPYSLSPNHTSPFTLHSSLFTVHNSQLPIYPSTHLPIYPSTHLPIYPSTHLPISNTHTHTPALTPALTLTLTPTREAKRVKPTIHTYIHTYTHPPTHPPPLKMSILQESNNITQRNTTQQINNTPQSPLRTKKNPTNTPPPKNGAQIKFKFKLKV
jgi:hypothetical protein